MSDPVITLALTLVLVLVAASRVLAVPGGRALWAARAVLTVLILVALLSANPIAERVAGPVGGYSYSSGAWAYWVARWISQLGIVTLALGIACAIEWAIGVFRRKA